MSKPLMRAPWIMLALLALAVIVIGLISGDNREESPVQARISVEGMPVTGFERAKPGRGFQFPFDHGPHPEFQTEWWYYTGNLKSAEGRRFGYQLTFFRRGLIPGDQVALRDSDWAASQVYLAHFTLTDVSANSFNFTERVSRGAAGLAGATGEPLFSVWLEDWHVRQTSSDRYELTARNGAIDLSLDLIDEKGPVAQGSNGYSQKGPDPGNASYYYSQTRLRSSGIITIGSEVHPVEGLSWMDHEFSTSTLAQNQVGWDWFSIQLDDRTELMVYEIRNSDGRVDPYSKGSLVLVDGDVVRLSSGDYTIDVIDTWLSPGSGAQYPSSWFISIPSQDLSLEVVPLIPDQELRVSFTYWEGAVRVEGEKNGKAISGHGYVEMTGYVHSMQGEF